MLQDVIENETANWNEQHPANKNQENKKHLTPQEIKSDIINELQSRKIENENENFDK